MSALYKEILITHYKKPQHRGNLQGATHTCRGRNPSCGDEVEVAVFYCGDALQEVRFEGRGCSICIASASMMSCAVEGLDVPAVRQLCDRVKTSLLAGAGAELPASVAALGAVLAYPARRRCALLCWDALQEAMQRAQD